ncbi:MAG: thiamine-phosphate kinase, partial [Stenotrophomonas acidaminiphila]|nr:thiamine-phosphate kinase [Stenotrophomonas acidaminiphila]
CALRGGDDYELCFTAAPERRQAVQALAADLALPLARIGVIAEGRGVHCEGDAGAGRSGYRHFAE